MSFIDGKTELSHTRSLLDILVSEKNLNYDQSLTSFDTEPEEQKIVLDAMYAIEDASCVRFTPRTNQADYVEIRVSASSL